MTTVWSNKKMPFILALIACGLVQVYVFHYGQTHHQSKQSLDALMGFVLNFILLGWCSADAEEKKVRIYGLLRFALILISLIGVPWYFVRSRGFVGALKGAFGMGLFAIWLITITLGVFTITVLHHLRAH